MKQEEDKFTGLPENAFRELKPGEVYNPLMGPSKNYPEVNIWSVAWGIAMAILFSAAAAYLGLKVGQVFEAAIPIAIIAVGVSGAAKRKNALGENVIIQSIGACSGVIVAGAIFTLPALYILQAKYPEMTVTFMQVFISSLLGGVLGILFLIPFRKYFVSDMHGKYPFPEATATTQVLISGEKGGSQAKPLLMAGMIGGLYDFIVATFGWWNENFTTRVCSAGEMLAEKAKLVFKVNTGAAVLGLGYIVGLKYASIICAGSFVSEIFGDEADELRRRGGDGGEFGATTGRPRRMGWFDCVASKYGCRLQGTTDVAFTVLDVLGYLDEIPVCTGYEINGEVTTEFPVTSLLEKAKPVLTKLPGWKCDIRGIKKYEELPENCRKYIEFIEGQIGYPITMVSNGPGRDDIIYRESSLNK